MGLRQPQFRRFSVKAKHLNRARRVYTAEHLNMAVLVDRVHLNEAGLFDIWGQSRSSIVPFDFERRFPPGGETSDLRPRLSANRIIYTLPAGRSNHRLPWRPTTKSKLTSPHHCNVMARSIRLQQPEQQKAALGRQTFELQCQRIHRKPNQFHTCLN